MKIIILSILILIVIVKILKSFANREEEYRKLREKHYIEDTSEKNLKKDKKPL